ncbi:MAG: hypothetical protein ABIJ34_09575 [archaeon]
MLFKVVHTLNSILVISLLSGLMMGCRPSQTIATSDETQAVPSCHYTTQQLKTMKRYIAEHEKPGLDFLVEMMQKNQTLTVGENHFNLADKYFVADSLKQLKEKAGLAYLAIEIDRNSKDMISDYANGKRDSLGFPALEYMIDKATEAGLELVLINPVENGIDRDNAMFDYLNEDIFSKYPHAKVLVYVGNNHTNEGYPSLEGYFRLAKYLSDYTGNNNGSIMIMSPSSLCDPLARKEYTSPIGFEVDYSPFSEFTLYESYDYNDPTGSFSLITDGVVLLDEEVQQ